MTVDVEFQEQNWVRTTRRATQARVLAHKLSERVQELFPHLFSTAPRVTALKNQGWSNFVIRLDIPGGDQSFILRLAQRREADRTSLSLATYEKELSILRKLEARSTVPAPVPYGSGHFSMSMPSQGNVEFAFLLQSLLPHGAANEKGAVKDRAAFLRQLGEHCRRLHETPVRGFGLEFDEAADCFTHVSFHDFVASQMKSVEESPASPAMKNWLAVRAAGLLEIKAEPRLFHRDLLGNWGNALVDAHGNVAGIIDWEFAGGGPAFHFEIASYVYVSSRDGHDTRQAEENLWSILAGYGMSRTHYISDYARDIETLVLMNAVGALVKLEAVRKRGALVDEPWRKVFADRASAMCEQCYSKDRRRQRRRKLPNLTVPAAEATPGILKAAR